MTLEQLAIRPAPSRWPIWATMGHTAGTVVYWLCGFLGEPGAETTPLPEAITGYGWEDHEDHPRGAGGAGDRARDDVAPDRSLSRPVDAGDDGRAVQPGHGRPPPVAHPDIGPPAHVQPRRLSRRRAVADAWDRGAAPDRPLDDPPRVGRVVAYSPQEAAERAGISQGGLERAGRARDPDPNRGRSCQRGRDSQGRAIHSLTVAGSRFRTRPPPSAAAP